MKEIIQDTARIMAQELPERCLQLGSFEGFYLGKGNYCQQLGILFLGTSRIDRLRVLSDIFERPITSMKDLTVAEALATLQYKELVWHLIHS